MTKFVAIVLLAAVILFALCGCVPPLREQSLTLNNGSVSDKIDSDRDDSQILPSRTLYVSGAVINDGYIDIPEICDYKTIFNIVGLCEFSAIIDNVSTFPNAASKDLYVDFIFEGKVCPSINVNGVLITSRMEIYGVSANVVSSLANYIESNGVIANREQLKLALGSNYKDNYYKFFIDRLDYA